MSRGLKANRLFATAIVLVATLAARHASAGQGELARQIVKSTGFDGGLAVHVGCGDGKLTAALRANDNCIVHGLDTDAKNIGAAREHIQSLGLYGKVSAERFDGSRLPYIDNLVNLVVAEALAGVPMSEVMRVLAPNGVAYIKRDGEWTQSVKPWPEEMDEWTHYLHDPQGTMTGRDKIIDLPRRLQWVGGPKWLRNHDFMSSLTGMVSSGGRIFYIIDEGMPKHIYLPARWTVIARDAFNGMILWKREIDQ